jgi:hypothetical protein
MDISLTWFTRSCGLLCALIPVGALGQSIRAAPLPQQGIVNETNGSYGQTLASVEVPPFHGLEPKISVSYSSGGGNSFVGVGASIQGFSRIERASPEKGSPSYSSSDIFVLDGEDLIPCAIGSTSPSCTSCPSGSLCFSAKREDFRRISIPSCGGIPCDSGNWTVAQKNGDQITYAPVLTVSTPSPAPNVFRWGISAVTDPIGNTMNFGWWCDGAVPGGECYPDHVSYGNGLATVALIRSGACTSGACSAGGKRPDPYAFATGAGLATVNYLLTSITVTVAGIEARSYQFRYATSASGGTGLPGTGRSVLQSVQEFGKDPATGFPASTLGFQSGTQAFSAPTPWANVPAPQIVDAYPGDFDGDGRTDLLLALGGESGVGFAGFQVFRSTGSGWVAWPVTTAFDEGVGITVADFTGDGMSDIGHSLSGNYGGGYEVIPSTGGGFPLSAWPIDYRIGQYVTRLTGDVVPVLVGDFNGDGLSDIAQWTGAALIVDISTGSGFVPWASCASCPQYLATLSGVGTHAYPPVTGDFNGDGKTDILQWDGTNWDVMLATGNCASPFTPSTAWASSTSIPEITRGVVPLVFFGDFNGDGKTDVLLYENDSAWHVLLSTGASFVDEAWTTPTNLVDSTTAGLNVTGDFNGDGLTDLVIYDGANWQVLLSTGTSFVLTGTNWGSASIASQVLTNDHPIAGDFDGNGTFDLMFLNSGVWTTELSAALPPLMTSFNNGLGGTVTIQYTPSSAWPESNNPPLLQTVTSVVVSDGLSAPWTTLYSYSNGSFDRPEREFLGFQTVTKTLPANLNEAAGPKETTTFLQDLYSYYKPASISSYDASGNLLRTEVFTYATNAPALPRVSLEASQGSYLYDNTASPASCGLDVVHSYDAFGNVTGEANFGVPPRYTKTEYAQDTAAYIVGLPGRVTTYRGTDATGTQTAQTLLLYDGSSSWTTAPTVGLLTSSQRWLNTSSGFVITSAQFDSHGNVVVKTDGDGNSTHFAYDPTYDTFLVSTTNALGQTTQSVWDFGCDETVSTQDLNGQWACVQYDSLCRPIETAGPGDLLTPLWNSSVGFAHDATNCAGNGGSVLGDNGNGPTTWTEYFLTGPGSQRVVSHMKDGSPIGLYQETFFDGLERPIQTCKKVAPPETNASESASESCNRTVYEPRGPVAQSFSAFYIAPNPAPAATLTPPPGATAQFTGYAYDALNRVTLEEFANGSLGSGTVFYKTTRQYAGWTTIVTNPNGFQTFSVEDNRGQVVEMQQQGCPTGSLATAVCVATTCEPLAETAACGATSCGTVPDGCGGTITCGTCPVAPAPMCSVCGFVNEACCAGSTCAEGKCINGTCSPCGGLTQPCCPNSSCVDGQCINGTCSACGGLNQPCCPTGAACSSGQCISGTCSACGGQGQPCCPAAPACTYGECINGTCGACGGLSQPCCPTAPACTSGQCISGTCTACGGLNEACCAGNACSSGVCISGTCSACGGLSDPCCPTAPLCTSGQCINGTCTACGGLGQACCSGNTCTSGVCISGTCSACGGITQPCCPTSPACTSGQCISGTCAACGGIGQPCCSGSTCTGGQCVSGTCSACGGLNQACCSGTTCTSGQCISGKCSACGGENEPCCPTGTACSYGSCYSGVCQLCGGKGAPCCGNSNTGYYCNTGLGCGNGSCETCGESGEPCCGTTTAGSCYSGTCSGGYCP